MFVNVLQDRAQEVTGWCGARQSVEKQSCRLDLLQRFRAPGAFREVFIDTSARGCRGRLVQVILQFVRCDVARRTSRVNLHLQGLCDLTGLGHWRFQLELMRVH